MIRFFAIAVICVSVLAHANSIEVEFSFSDSTGETDVLPSGLMKIVGDAYEHNIHGIEQLEAGNLDEAMLLFEKALELYPNYSDPENNRGVVYFRRGEIGLAEQTWQGLCERDKDYAIARYNLAMVAFHKNRHEDALAQLNKAIRINKRFTEAHVMTGKLLVAEGEHRDAMSFFEKAFEIDPQLEASWGMYAFGLLKSGDTAQAVALLREHADNGRALQLLGTIEAARGNHNTAADLFTRAVVLGADPSALVQLAVVLLDSGLCKEALNATNSFLRRVPQGSADAWLVAGLARKECEDIPGARETFEMGINNFPADPLLRFNLGQIYFYLKEYKLAEATWSLLSDSLEDPSVYHLRAIMARKRGKLHDAEQNIRRALELDDKALYHDYLGILLYEKGDKKGAVSQFKKALRIDPNLRSAKLNLALTGISQQELAEAVTDKKQELDTCEEDCGPLALQLSVLYYQQKRIDDGISLLEALPENNRNEPVYRHLAFLYRNQQKWDKAIALLEKARRELALEVETEHELVESYMAAGYYSKAVPLLEQLLTKWHRRPWRLHYQLGYAYMEQGKLEQAARHFEKSLDRKRNNVAARGLLAFVSNRLGNTSRARELWETNLKEDPSNAAMWINMGLVHENDGDLKEALRHFSQAELLNKGDKGIHLNIGNVYTSLGQHNKAMAAYALAMDSKKRDAAIYNSFILAQRMHNRDKAARMLQLLRKEFPNSLYAARANADMVLSEGDTTRALHLFNGLKEKNANDWFAIASIHANRGDQKPARQAMTKLPTDTLWAEQRIILQARLAYSAGDFQRSFELWKSIRDTSFATRYNIALAALKAEQYATAHHIASQLAMTALGGDKADACRVAGNAAFGLKQWDEARSWYLQLSGFESRDPVVQYNLAVAYHHLGKPAKAWDHYTRAQSMDPKLKNQAIEKAYSLAGQVDENGSMIVLDSLDRLYNQAVDFQSQKNDTAAERLYRVIVEADPRHEMAWNNLGAILAARGDLYEAERCYRKAIERKHSLVEAYANLVNIYLAKSELDKAKKWIFKARAHNPNDSLLQQIEKDVNAALTKSQQSTQQIE